MSAKVDQVNAAAQAVAQGLIAADAKLTMAGMEPKQMKERAATVLSGAMPSVKGCVEALAKDEKTMETEEAEVLAVRAVALAAFGTSIGLATK